MRGLTLTAGAWVSACSLRLRPDLQGLTAAGEAGRSERSFLRGVRLLSVSTDVFCFLFVGVKTLWGKKEIKGKNKMSFKANHSHNILRVQVTVRSQNPNGRQNVAAAHPLKSYAALFSVRGPFALRFFLWFGQRAQILLSENLHLKPRRTQRDNENEKKTTPKKKKKAPKCL